jgi:tRNA (guanine-N7-)-methyltransferase
MSGEKAAENANVETPHLDYHATTFSQGRMNFTWEELSEEARQQAYADWQAGKGLIGGNPLLRPNSHLLPEWALGQPFFRALALDDSRGYGARLRALLASDCPVEVEIGFGRGDFLLDRAKRHTDTLFIGYETKTKAARLMLQRINRFGISKLDTDPTADTTLSSGNLWVSDDDVRFSMPLVIEDGRLDAVHILFPDPWWKPQHHVKRLFSPPFVDLLAAKLRSGALLHFKSDVQEYGELVRYLVEGHGAFLPHDPALAERIGPYALTHREAWCVRNQRPVYAYYFVRR